MATATRNEPRPIPSDATLVWLASERAAPLFRTLDRARAFGPLVILLAALPPMLATFGDAVTPVDAAWGLRALDATGSEMPAEAGPAVERTVPAEAVRPMPLWLSAGLMRMAGPASPVAGSLASLIGGALLLGTFWPLAKSLSGRRFAFWAVVLAAFHPTLAELLRFPAPVTIGLAASAAALWGSMNLDGKPLRFAVAMTGTVAAIVAALAVAGAAALVVPVVIVADALLGLVLPARPPARSSARGAATPAESAARRISTAAAGAAVWAAAEWLVLGSSATFGGDGPVDVGDGEASIVGPLWGLAAIGLGRLLRVVHRRAAVKTGRPVPRMVLVWLLAAGGLLLWRGGTPQGDFDPTGRYVVAFASLPVLLAAAYAIEEAARRIVSGAWVLLAVALPLAVRLGTLMATIRAEGPPAWIALAVVGLLAFWIVTRAVPAGLAMPGVRRGMLMGAILVAIAVNGVEGAAVLLRGEPDAEPYRRLTSQLESAGRARAAVLLADGPTLPLTFAVRASYSRAALTVAGSWDQAVAALARSSGDGELSGIVVAWGMREGGGGFAENLTPVGEPLAFADRELLIYGAGSRQDDPRPAAASDPRDPPGTGSPAKNALDAFRRRHYIPAASGT